MAIIVDPPTIISDTTEVGNFIVEMVFRAEDLDRFEAISRMIDKYINHSRLKSDCVG